MHESLRTRLAALGVPPERQSRERLEALFPPEFRIGEAHLDTNMLAEVLISFVQHGLISLEQQLDAAEVTRRAVGKHICHFYGKEAELLELVPVYIKAGLDAGQRCLWGMPRWLDAERAQRALGDLYDPYTVILVPERELYTSPDGAPRPLKELSDFWRAQEQAAIEAGFSGLRVCGDATCRTTDDGWSGFLAYEQDLSDAIGGSRLVALCTFSLCEVSEQRLAEALTGHDCGIVHRRGAWDEIRAGAGAAAVLRALAEDRC